MSSEQVWVKIEDIAILRPCECGKSTESVDSGAAVQGGWRGWRSFAVNGYPKNLCPRFLATRPQWIVRPGWTILEGTADLFCRRGPCTHSKPRQGSVAGFRSV